MLGLAGEPATHTHSLPPQRQSIERSKYEFPILLFIAYRLRLLWAVLEGEDLKGGVRLLPTPAAPMKLEVLLS